ncbi:NAD dependent epimerase/dehydratase [Histoplasma capsulatum]|uniref:NAD dependent epimerase/dehydratase n=1 Tax=Ajellomyces capsulatus TaxID=5037 RepID=A0A8A1M3G5_AJECA|nr:NAD dependent epimerase/dehydratase [Histoplasma capsulatum]
MEAHSNAKALLITRGVDSWNTSVMKSIWWRATDLEHRLTSNYSWAAGMYYPMLQKFFDICFTGDFPNKGKQIYLNHVEGGRTPVLQNQGVERFVDAIGASIFRFPDGVSWGKRRNEPTGLVDSSPKISTP